jgi:hypothetical protein
LDDVGPEGDLAEPLALDAAGVRDELSDGVESLDGDADEAEAVGLPEGAGAWVEADGVLEIGGKELGEGARVRGGPPAHHLHPVLGAADDCGGGREVCARGLEGFVRLTAAAGREEAEERERDQAARVPERAGGVGEIGGRHPHINRT